MEIEEIGPMGRVAPSGGSKGGSHRWTSITKAQNYPNFIVLFFFEILTKLYVGAPWRVGTLSYRESWICPCP